MDGIIQMLPPSLRKYSTYIDFEGQRKAERIFQVILVVHGVVGFLAGYVTQQMSVMIYSICVGFIISCLLTLPPWPIYRRHPINANVVEGGVVAPSASATTKVVGTKKRK